MRGEECFDGTAGSPGIGLNLKLLEVAFILIEKYDIESHSICLIATCTFTRMEVKGGKNVFGIETVAAPSISLLRTPSKFYSGIRSTRFFFA